MVQYSGGAVRAGETVGDPRRAPAGELGLVEQRTRPLVLANEELIPVAPVFSSLLGLPGLRRGSTTVIERAGGAGVTSLALGLLTQATISGMWCAAVGLPALGLVAASELGVALDHLVLVPDPQRRLWQVSAALLDGCDVVLVKASIRPSASEARRLGARARERRTALIVLLDSPTSGAAAQHWPEGPDVTISTTGGRFLGLGAGAGRIDAHLVEVRAVRRRGSPREIRASLWLPSIDGSLSDGSLSDGTPADGDAHIPIAHDLQAEDVTPVSR